MKGMMKHTLLIVIALLCAAACPAQTTLEACQQQAQQNYPLIKRRALYAQSTAYTIANIKKGWLPQVQVAAQGTVQNRVAQLPEQLSNMMAALGQSTRGLAKEQYRVGVDVNQMLWDGGRISAQKDVARLQQQVDEAQTDVSLYQVRQRVNDLYFGICTAKAGRSHAKRCGPSESRTPYGRANGQRIATHTCRALPHVGLVLQR